MRHLITAATMALTALPGIAQAAQAPAEPPCLTAGEFTALASYAMPSVINGTVQRCTAALPADAWLKRNGGELVDRYAQLKPRVWPQAKAAFMKMGAGSTSNKEAADLMRGLPDTTLQPLVDGMVEGMIAQKLPTERCATIDRLVRLLAPLPPENTAELVGMAVGLGSRSGNARVGSFAICKP